MTKISLDQIMSQLSVLNEDFNQTILMPIKLLEIY